MTRFVRDDIGFGASMVGEGFPPPSTVSDPLLNPDVVGYARRAAERSAQLRSRDRDRDASFDERDSRRITRSLGDRHSNEGWKGTSVGRVPRLAVRIQLLCLVERPGPPCLRLVRAQKEDVCEHGACDDEAEADLNRMGQ